MTKMKSTEIASKLFDSCSQLPASFQVDHLPPRPQETHLAMALPAPSKEDPSPRVQWESLREALKRDGCQVEELPARTTTPGLVHLPARVFLGEDSSGNLLCVPARVEDPGARTEALVAASFFLEQGYRISQVVPDGATFGASADALWHPGRRLLWGATSPHTCPQAYPPLAKLLEVPVFRLDLVDPAFASLNTCFWPLDASTALIYEAAFAPPSLALLKAVFPSLVPVSRQEAEGAALGGLSLPGKRALLHKGSAGVCELLRMLGYSVREIAVGSFSKTGGVSSLVIRYRG
jgi:N-dimethylarginine dimethylaminohydrolase